MIEIGGAGDAVAAGIIVFAREESLVAHTLLVYLLNWHRRATRRVPKADTIYRYYISIFCRRPRPGGFESNTRAEQKSQSLI